MNSDIWAELTEDERDKFFVARKKLISDGTIDQDEAGCQVAPSKDTTTETSSDEQIIADLRKELKELEKNSETKSKSTITETTFDMTGDQAISGLNRKTKPEYSNLSKQSPTLTSATRHRTSDSGECQRAIQSSYYSYE